MANSSLSPMATEELTRDQYVYLAKLAKEAKRYKEMASFMEKVVVGSSSSTEEFTDEERDLLYDAYTNVIGSLRKAGRILSSIEKNDENALVKEYRSTVETELSEMCSGIVKLLDDHLVSSASTSESKVVCFAGR